jgi:hypothetical protein
MFAHGVHAIAVDVFPLEIFVAAGPTHLVIDIRVRERHQDTALFCADAVFDFFVIHENVFVEEADLLKRGAVKHEAGAEDEIERLLCSLARQASAAGEIGDITTSVGLNFPRPRTTEPTMPGALIAVCTIAEIELGSMAVSLFRSQM